MNPVVPYSHNNFQRESFVNHVTLMNASVKKFEIRVYSIQGQATFLANQLKIYLEANPIGLDNISIGLRAEVWDATQQRYVVSMIMDTGNLMMMGTVLNVPVSTDIFLVDEAENYLVDASGNLLISEQ